MREPAEERAGEETMEQAAGSTIRVLVVDDSLVCREMLAQILASAPDITVVGTARDGLEAVELAKQLRPSLITMDIHMPRMDGVAATEEIMAWAPTPILVVSSSVRPDQTGPAFDALAAGALDVLKKPEPKDWSDLDKMGNELIAKVRLLSGVHVVTHLAARLKDRSRRRAEAREIGVPAGDRLLAVGSSTGGPSALMTVLSGLPGDFPYPVVVAQHIADGFIAGLVEWLRGQCAIRVKEGVPGEELRPGEVAIAPTGGHARVERGCLVAVEARAEDLYQPSCDVLFESVAEGYRSRAVGVILTGMGSDGAKGLKRLHDAGGYTIAQDEATSVVYGMPRAAKEIGAVDVVAPLSRIADEVLAAFEAPVR